MPGSIVRRTAPTRGMFYANGAIFTLRLCRIPPWSVTPALTRFTSLFNAYYGSDPDRFRPTCGTRVRQRFTAVSPANASCLSRHWRNRPRVRLTPAESKDFSKTLKFQTSHFARCRHGFPRGPIVRIRAGRTPLDGYVRRLTEPLRTSRLTCFLPPAVVMRSEEHTSELQSR